MKNWILLFSLIFLFNSAFTKDRDTLIVGYKMSPPFVIEQNGTLTGPSVWLWNKISKELNIPYKYVELNLNQLLSNLKTGEIDIVLSPLTITSERSEAIYFSSPYYITHSSLIQKFSRTNVESLSYWRAFFSMKVLKTIGVFVLLILGFGFVVWLFERRVNKKEFGNGIKGLWSGFWWSAVTMTTVGYGDKSPRTIGGRLVALIWMFSAIIIISILTASIASTLTVKKIEENKNTVHDFKEKKIGTIINSATDKWLINNFYSYKKTYKEIPNMILALENGEIDAIAYDRPILKRVINSDTSSSFRLLKVEFNPQFYAMGMNMDLTESLKHRINLILLENTEKTEWKVVLRANDLDF